MNVNSVDDEVSTALEEDLDLMTESGQIDMNLTILVIIFVFDGHGSSSG